MEYTGDPGFYEFDKQWIIDGPNSGGVRLYILWHEHLFLVERDFSSSSISRGIAAVEFAAAYRGSDNPRYRQIVEDLDARMGLDYFGAVVDAATLEGLLRTAVDHTPATTNRDLAFDPDAWTSGLLDQLAGTPLEVRAREVLTAMARTGSPAELRFAAQHDAGRDLVRADVLLDVLDRATEPPTRTWLARSLNRAIRAGRLAYTPRLRAVIGEPEVQDDLLGAIVLHDHVAFLGGLDAIFGAAAPAAKLRAFCAATGLNHAEVTRLRDELAASALPDEIRAATTAALDEVLAHPATAKRTGGVRW